VRTGIAQQRIVKVGPTRGDQVAILDGIKEGMNRSVSTVHDRRSVGSWRRPVV